MEQNKTLVEILSFYKWDCDKDPNCGNKRFPAHTYLEIYDKLFEPYKYEKINVLEIGILRGTSIKLWSEYFPNATIYGMDTFEREGMATWDGCGFNEVSENLKDINHKVKLIQVNSCSEDEDEKNKRIEVLNSIPDGFFHIIIDDGSHELNDQIQTYYNFKSKLNKDGIFIVEDIGFTNDKPIEPQLLIDAIPELKLIDMRFPKKYDNALALYFDKKSNHFKYHNNYFKSKPWTTEYKFTYEYIIKKQNEQ